jgi:hypothetical protein
MHFEGETAMLTKSWTKNAEQIKKIEETLHAPIFADARWLAVQYLTRPEIGSDAQGWDGFDR